MDNREQKQENNEGQKENQNQENNEIKQEKNQKHNDQQDESDHRQNRPEALYDLRNDLNEEYKPFDNGYDSPLSSPVIREKIESVLHFNSLPLVEHGSLESQLYDSWHTNNDTSMNSSLSRDFFSVEHIQQRERSPSFSPLRFPNYLPAAFQHPISNHPAQFDSLTSNLSSSLFGTPPIIPTSHLSPGNLQPDSQSIRPPTSIRPCRYCMATYTYPQDHNKKECPKLACMKPCKICHASGQENHTLIESPILRIIRSVPLALWFYNIILEHCPFKKKIVLKLKCDKRNDDGKGKKDDKDDKNDKYG